MSAMRSWREGDAYVLIKVMLTYW